MPNYFPAVFVLAFVRAFMDIVEEKRAPDKRGNEDDGAEGKEWR